jgi:VWFA-related protein
MRRRFAVVLSFVVFLATTSWAQQQPFSETLEVNIVNIDVTVRDRAGNPVTGLTRDDFEVLENGKPQAISNFFEERGVLAAAGGAPAAAPAAGTDVVHRPRRIAVFIDQSSVDPLERNRVLTALREFLETQLRPADEILVATWMGRMTVLQNFTTDRSLVAKAVAAASKNPGGGRTWKAEKSRIQTQVRQELDMALEPNSKGPPVPEVHRSAKHMTQVYAESLARAMRTMAADLGQLTEMFGAYDGKKAIVFVGQNLPQVPGADLYQYMDDLFRPLQFQHRLSPLQTDALSKSEALTHEQIAKTANAAGVTYYLIHSGDLTGLDSSKVEQNDISPGMGNHEAIDAQNQISSFNAIAQATGGVAVAGRRDYARALSQIQRDLDFYYSLGYKAPSPAGGNRNLRVRVKGRDELVVRARNSYEPKSMKEEIEKQTLANLLQSRSEKAVGVTITNQPPVPHENGVAKVPTTIQIDLDSLTLLPQEGNLVGGFDIFVAVGNSDGNVSPVSHQHKPLSFPEAQKTSLKGQKLTFNVDILMRKGTNVLSVAVSDAVGGDVGFARHEIVVP